MLVDRLLILTARLQDAIERINPTLGAEAVASAVATVLRPESQNATAENLRVHRLITQGVSVQYRDASGGIRHTLAWLLDFEDPSNNDWVAINQYTVIEAGHSGAKSAWCETNTPPNCEEAG